MSATSNELSELISAATRAPTIVHLLPGLLSFKGAPYSLEDYYVFEPLFSTESPTDTVFRASRQVGKSAALAALTVVSSAARPYYKALHVTPLRDQIYKFSNDYVREIISESPIRTLLRSDKRAGSVTRRQFQNKSVLYFSYAFESADRIRGISLAPFGRVNIDEVQDMHPDFLPAIGEVLSACKSPCSIYSGTSKTKVGALEMQWMQSSMAEWVTRCTACNHENIASIEHDLLKMIGPYRNDISRERPATICSRCGRFIYPRTGRWRHRRPSYRMTFAGYHIPQVILPMHFEHPEKWALLHAKMRGERGFTKSTFYNEVLGEPSDDEVTLVSMTDLKKAAVLHRNTEEDAIARMHDYVCRVIGVDWGGGGIKGISLTAIAVLGLRADGVVDVIFGKKMPGTAHEDEARECVRLFHLFRCSCLAHDYTGAGDLRETLMTSNGMSADNLMPIQYSGPAMGSIIKHSPPTLSNSRHRWTANKTRTLQLTCKAIRSGKLRTFAYDFVSPEDRGLLHDFLSLIENKVIRPGGSDAYMIIRSAHLADDFAQAVNLGLVATWHISGMYPSFVDAPMADDD